MKQILNKLDNVTDIPAIPPLQEEIEKQDATEGTSVFVKSGKWMSSSEVINSIVEEIIESQLVQEKPTRTTRSNRSAPVSYTEPSLRKKMRKGDEFSFGEGDVYLEAKKELHNKKLKSGNNNEDKENKLTQEEAYKKNVLNQEQKVKRKPLQER